MKTKFIAFLATCACVGVLKADALTVTSYDFNSLLVSGAGAGDATMTINGETAMTTPLGADALLATGLSAGNVYKYEVTLGGNPTSGEVTMGNGTGKLFGADATGSSPVLTEGGWNTTAPYVASTVDANKYVLQGSCNKFDVTENLMSGKKIVYIDSTMTFTDGADELDENLMALGAFTLAQLDETSDACSWVGLTGGDPKWVPLTGDITAAPGTYVSRMEFDFNTTPAQVRYLVGSSASNLTVLKDDSGNEWFTVAANSAAVSSVAFEGTGFYTKLEGSSINANVAEVDGTGYATIAAALTSQKTGATVTLLTNTRPEANAALVDGSWTINENGKTFSPYDAAGYTHTYEGYAFAVTKFTASMDLSIASKTLGYDYTNATLKVAIANADIQAGNPVTITATVKDASGETVETKSVSGITGNGNVDFALTKPVVAKGEYTVEFSVAQQGETVQTTTNSFIAASTANWFDARKTRWSTDGTWKIGEEPQTISTEKIALGGNQYDFTPSQTGVAKGFIRVDTVIEVDGAIDNDDLPTETNVQGMLTLAETSDESATPVWKAFVGGSWQALTGGATEPGTYTVRAEFDYAGTDNKVRYSVAKGDADFTVLTLSGSEWLANGQSTVTTLAGASAMGMGNLVSMKGESIDAYVAEVNGVKYESLAAAFAAAGDNVVKILWNCTWDPTVGAWRIDRNGKSLLINAADGIFVSDVDGLLRVNDVAVAKIGTTEYGFLDVAFTNVAANETVEMLANVVQNYNVVQMAPSATLDLAGHFVKIADGKTFAAPALTITNSTEKIGGFNGVFAAGSTYTIVGGKWATDTDTAHLMPGFAFSALKQQESVDGVEYAYVVIETIPMGDDVKVVIPDDDVKALIGATTGMTKEQIAAKLKEEGVNGYPIIQSYVLGLTPTDPTSKPVVATEQIADEGKVKISLDNVNVKAGTGVTVTYQLETADNASFSDSSKGKEQSEASFSADVPATGSKVKYYKINILFSNDK